MERQVNMELVNEVKDELYYEFLELLIARNKLLNDEDYDVYEDDVDFEPIDIPDGVSDITRCIMEAYNSKDVSGLEFMTMTQGVQRSQYKRIADIYKDPFMDSPINRITKELGYGDQIEHYEKMFRELYIEES